MNNSVNNQLLDMLSNLDPNKLNQLNSLLNNLSKEEINTIMSLLNKNIKLNG